MSTDRKSDLSALHVRGDPLVLINAWDVASARALAAEGLKAIATSSGAIAAAQGFRDGHHMPLDLLLPLVERIAAAVKLPVTVDFEGGYGETPGEVATNVRRLLATGISGLNLEDSLSDKKRALLPAEQHAEVLGAACEAAGSALFVNARIDTFLLSYGGSEEERIAETLRRASVYVKAGADGIFVPGASSLEILTALARGIDRPLNAMAVAGFPDLAALAGAGVARVSFGGWPLTAALQFLRNSARRLMATGNVGAFGAAN